MIGRTATNLWIWLLLTGSWFSINNFILGSRFDSTRKKEPSCVTWKFETLILLKAREVITENIIYLKYQKQAIAAALNREDVLMLLPTALRKLWIYQVLSLILSWNTSPIRNKIPDQEFFWGADHEFYSRLRIWNCKLAWSLDSLQKISSENWRYCTKVKAHVYKMKVVIQNSAIKDYHKFHIRLHKDLEIIILMALILLLKRVILQWLHARPEVHF